MPPVELESDLLRAREDMHALMFRFDDFTYSAALRGLFSIDTAFDDRPCYIAPAKDVVQLDLFERLPEVDLAPAVHKVAWSALEAVLRSLMSDPTLLMLVRGEPRHGSVSFGYHASAPYALVERVISERVSVLQLRALREAAEHAARSLTVDERAASLARDCTTSDEATRERVRAWARGDAAWDKRWSDEVLTASALATNIARTFDSENEADRRVADRLLGAMGGLEAWIRAVPPDPLRDHFAPVRNYVLSSGRMGEDALLAHCIVASGGVCESGAWWWTLGSLSNHARVEGVLRSMDRPEYGVEGLVAIAKSAKPSIPVVLEHVRAIGERDARWISVVKSGLG
jgi:hypothetical protein